MGALVVMVVPSYRNRTRNVSFKCNPWIDREMLEMKMVQGWLCRRQCFLWISYFGKVMGVLHFWNILQGLSERMSKVKCSWKSQFSQKISFLNCFRSEISGKFIPFSNQVHQNHPKSSLQAGAFDVLSGCDRLFEADHWLWNSEKRPKIGVSVCEGQN